MFLVNREMVLKALKNAKSRKTAMKHDEVLAEIDKMLGGETPDADMDEMARIMQDLVTEEILIEFDGDKSPFHLYYYLKRKRKKKR